VAPSPFSSPCSGTPPHCGTTTATSSPSSAHRRRLLAAGS
jgi:hypothetical protein